jgi:hypothetical protein
MPQSPQKSWFPTRHNAVDSTDHQGSRAEINETINKPPYDASRAFVAVSVGFSSLFIGARLWFRLVSARLGHQLYENLGA